MLKESNLCQPVDSQTNKSKALSRTLSSFMGLTCSCTSFLSFSSLPSLLPLQLFPFHSSHQYPLLKITTSHLFSLFPHKQL